MKIRGHILAASLAIAGSVIAAAILSPKSLFADQLDKFDYSEITPSEFGDWKIDPNVRLVVPVEPDALANKIYSQMVGRGYVDKAGNAVMLLIAYGPRQTDSLQLHRPEICYVAEGFTVIASTPGNIRLADNMPEVNVRRMTAQREGRVERISYWMRIGDEVVSSLLSRQAVKLRYGLTGVIPDGVLVRVSSINVSEASAVELHNRFLRELFAAIGAENRRHFVGAPLAAPRPRTG